MTQAPEPLIPLLKPDGLQSRVLPVWRTDSRAMSLPDHFREAWKHRKLLFIFSWRDITLRYKQTAIGVLWVLLQPLLMMVVFSIFFSGTMPADGLPYPIFVYTGLTIWQLFAKVLSQSTTTLKEHESIITRVYFPRILLFASVVLVALVDFVVSLTVIVPMLLYYSMIPPSRFWLFPVFVLLAVLAALSVGIWLALLDVVYRDVRQTLPVLLQAWMFCSPLFYSRQLVGPNWQTVFVINPMVGAMDGLRWCLLPGASPPHALGLVISTAITLVLLVGGLFFYKRREGNLVDLL